MYNQQHKSNKNVYEIQINLKFIANMIEISIAVPNSKKVIFESLAKQIVKSSLNRESHRVSE